MNITVDRKVLEMALEALDWEDCNDDDGYERAKQKAITALRTALEQPEQEPVAWMHVMDNTEGIKANGKGIVSITQKRKHPFGKPGVDFSKSYPVTSTPLYTTPPQRNPEQEYRRGDRLVCLETDEYCVIHISGTTRQWVKFPDTHIGVYTNEQVSELFEKLSKETDLAQSKPLTDDEIQSIWKNTFESGSSINTFVRVIETVHGIKEEQ